VISGAIVLVSIVSHAGESTPAAMLAGDLFCGIAHSIDYNRPLSK
jgi:hypothetical protein